MIWRITFDQVSELAIVGKVVTIIFIFFALFDVVSDDLKKEIKLILFWWKRETWIQ